MSRWTSASGWAVPGTTPRTEVTSPADEDHRIPLVEPRTERLVLRQWRDEDWAPFAALNADPEVMRHFPSTLDEQESNAFAYRNAALLEVHGYGLWAVEVLGSGTFVGLTGLNRPMWDAAFTPCVEVGSRSARSGWTRSSRSRRSPTRGAEPSWNASG